MDLIITLKTHLIVPKSPWVSYSLLIQTSSLKSETTFKVLQFVLFMSHQMCTKIMGLLINHFKALNTERDVQRANKRFNTSSIEFMIFKINRFNRWFGWFYLLIIIACLSTYKCSWSCTNTSRAIKLFWDIFFYTFFRSHKKYYAAVTVCQGCFPLLRYIIKMIIEKTRRGIFSRGIEMLLPGYSKTGDILTFLLSKFVSVVSVDNKMIEVIRITSSVTKGL